MPRVLTSGGHHARRAGSGSHPNHGPQVAQVSRVLQQHDVTRTSQDRVRIWLNRTPSHGNDLTARHHILERLNVHNLKRDTHVRGKALEQVLHLPRVRGPRSENLAPEPDRVLDRVKALQNHEAPRPSGTADVCELHPCAR